VTEDHSRIQTLAVELAQLRDLFQRRLLEDRAKQRLYDELYTQLEFARSDLAIQFVAPFAREILLVVDRIESTIATEDSAGTDILRSISQELTEILNRRGLRRVDALGEMFDPHIHEAIDTVSVPGPGDHARVVEQRRPGFILDGRLIRPAQVVVGDHPTTAATSSGDGALPIA
jgi:molecular chaperone GrpE